LCPVEVSLTRPSNEQHKLGATEKHS
jgi:hypothetical protein